MTSCPKNSMFVLYDQALPAWFTSTRGVSYLYISFITNHMCLPLDCSYQLANKEAGALFD